MGFGGGWDSPQGPNFGNAAIVAGSITVVGPNSPYLSRFPAGSTNPLTTGEAGAIFDEGGFAINLGGPKYRAIGTWDPVAGTGDVLAAWNQAVTDAAGGTVFAPNGIYNTTSGTLQTASGDDTAGATSVEGAGWATIFQSSTISPVMRMSPQFESHGGHFSNFRIDGLAIANGLRGLDIGSLAASSTIRAAYISSIRFTRLAIGLQFVNTQGFAVEGCKFGANTGAGTLACAIGARISDNSEIGTFHNCDFRGNTGTSLLLDNSGPISGGVLVQGIYNWIFSQCQFESNAGKAVVLDGGTYNLFIGCKYEQNADTYITLQSTASGTRCDGNTFVGGYYNGNPPTPTVLFVDLQASSGTSFIGGFFNPASNGGINIAAGGTNTSFEYCALNCTVTDASVSTSYWNPINVRFARTRVLVGLTDQASIVVDPSLGEVFKVTLAGNRTIGAATNIQRQGQRVTFLIYQDGTGGRTLAWTNTGNESWIQAWSDTGNTAGKRSTISFIYDLSTRRWIQEGAQGPYV